MAEKQAFRNYAFVSYSHKDEKWAKWLQTRLENYRLPAAIREMAQEPLGIDVRELGRIDAFLKVISSLLDVRHDQIVMRHKRRALRNRMIGGFLAAICAIAIGGSIWWNTPPQQVLPQLHHPL